MPRSISEAHVQMFYVLIATVVHCRSQCYPLGFCCAIERTLDGTALVTVLRIMQSRNMSLQKENCRLEFVWRRCRVSHTSRLVRVP